MTSLEKPRTVHPLPPSNTTILYINGATYIVNASFNGKGVADLGSRLARLVKKDLESRS